MSDERLRRLYQQGIAAREARGAGACEVAPEELLALARGELPEERRLEMLDRVMASERCRAEFELLRAIELAGRGPADRGSGGDERDDGGAPRREDGPEVTAFPAPSSAALPADVLPLDRAGHAATGAARRRRAWWRGAAVPAALAATALLAVGLARFADPDRPSAGVTRGADDASVTVVAPAGEIGPGARPTFVWRPVDGASRYAFELLAADGSLLHETVTPDTVATLPDHVVLPPGADLRWIVRALDPAGAERGSVVRPLGVGER